LFLLLGTDWIDLTSPLYVMDAPEAFQPPPIAVISSRRGIYLGRKTRLTSERAKEESP